MKFKDQADLLRYLEAFDARIYEEITERGGFAPGFISEDPHELVHTMLGLIPCLAEAAEAALSTWREVQEAKAAEKEKEAEAV